MKAIQLNGTSWFLSKIKKSPGGLPTELKFSTKYWEAKTYNSFIEAIEDVHSIINDKEGFLTFLDIKIIDL